MQKKLFRYISLLLALSLFSLGCREGYTPKPRGYFRIDLPQKEYALFESACPFSFEYPVYGHIVEVDEHYADPCWYNIDFNEYNAKIYLTYKPLEDNLGVHIEDVRKLVYKHIVKADDIQETLIQNPEDKVYGLVYDIGGNTASSVNFFLTDSSHHFLSGSLYFNSVPNTDSLAPAIQFFREDMLHLMESLKWK